MSVLPCGQARAAGWADALFSERGHDFGPVARGVKVRHSFALTNRLNESITILNIRASCGCTSGKASATTIAPGQTATIDAEMDTRNFTAKKATTLYVSLVTASGQEAEVRLAVTSLILSDIVLNPGTIDFGSVAKGQSLQKTLTIERIASPQWEVTRMLSACKAIDALIVETSRSPVSVTYQLTVTLKPEAPAGILRDEIQIVTNDPETPRIVVQLNGQIRGDLTAYPSVLALGKVTSAAGVQGRYMVRGTKPFRIVSIEGNGDGFKLAAANSEPTPMHMLSITYNPAEGSSRGDLARSFRVVTDLPGEPPVDLTATLHVDP
jgi:hypothetical protein